MINRLGMLVLIMLFIFAILVSTTRLLGTPSTVPTIIQLTPGCAAGCWNGIHIGQTTMSEAESILKKDHFIVSIDPYNHLLGWTENTANRGSIFPVYDAQGKATDKVDRIYIYLNGKRVMSLGDAIQLWGEPVGTNILFCSRPYYTNGYTTVLFKGDIQVRVDPSRQINNVILSPSALTPNTVITEISYVSEDNRNFPPELQIWKGFVRFPPNYLVSDDCG